VTSLINEKGAGLHLNGRQIGIAISIWNAAAAAQPGCERVEMLACNGLVRERSPYSETSSSSAVQSVSFLRVSGAVCFLGYQHLVPSWPGALNVHDGRPSG
jgi:hypothetical protein